VQKSTLIWGIGLVSAVLGVGALLVGSIIEPVQQQTSAEVVVTSIFLRSMIALLALAVAFGLACYAGTRVAPVTTGDRVRVDATIAGGLVLACYWIATTVCIFVQGNADVREGSVLTTRVIFGVLFVLIGAGIGGLGSRAYAARQLLQNITLTVPAASPAPPATIDEV
jgi:hypothetical protein